MLSQLEKTIFEGYIFIKTDLEFIKIIIKGLLVISLSASFK